MSTATLTAQTAAGDLLADLRRIEGHLDGIGNLDDLRARLDELTAALRRTRGRIARLAQKAAARTERPAEKPEPAKTMPEPVGGVAARESNPHHRAAVDRPGAPTASAEPTAAMPLPRLQDAPPLSAYRRSPLDEAASLQACKARAYDGYQATVLRTELGMRAHEALETPVPSAPRRGRLRIVIAALVMVCSAVAAGVGQLLDRVRALFAADRPELEEAPDLGDCEVCGPGCCSPLLGVHGRTPGNYVGRTVVSVR